MTGGDFGWDDLRYFEFPRGMAATGGLLDEEVLTKGEELYFVILASPLSSFGTRVMRGGPGVVVRRKRTVMYWVGLIKELTKLNSFVTVL